MVNQLQDAEFYWRKGKAVFEAATAKLSKDHRGRWIGLRGLIEKERFWLGGASHAFSYESGLEAMKVFMAFTEVEAVAAAKRGTPLYVLLEEASHLPSRKILPPRSKAGVRKKGQVTLASTIGDEGNPPPPPTPPFAWMREYLNSSDPERFLKDHLGDSNPTNLLGEVKECVLQLAPVLSNLIDRVTSLEEVTDNFEKTTVTNLMALRRGQPELSKKIEAVGTDVLKLLDALLEGAFITAAVDNFRPRDRYRSIECSFCEKPQREAKTMVAGPPDRGSYICDECVEEAAIITRGQGGSGVVIERRSRDRSNGKFAKLHRPPGRRGRR